MLRGLNRLFPRSGMTVPSCNERSAERRANNAPSVSRSRSSVISRRRRPPRPDGRPRHPRRLARLSPYPTTTTRLRGVHRARIQPRSARAKAMQPAVGCRGRRQTCRKMALPRPGTGGCRFQSSTATRSYCRSARRSASWRQPVRRAHRPVVGRVAGVVGPAVEGADCSYGKTTGNRRETDTPCTVLPHQNRLDPVPPGRGDAVALGPLDADAAAPDRAGEPPPAEPGAPAPDHQVAHKICPLLAGLGLQIVCVEPRPPDLQRHPLDHLEPAAVHHRHLRRVVGDQPQPLEPHRPQHVGPDTKIPLVILEPQPMVRLHGIEPLILQRIGPHLVSEPDPPSLLVQIKQHPRPLPPICPSAALSCAPQSHFKLPSKSPVKQAECSRQSSGARRSGAPTSTA